MRRPHFFALAFVIPAFFRTGGADCVAQTHSEMAVVSALLISVDSSLRKSSYARLQGPTAFDEGIIQAPKISAPTIWPDSLILGWIGNVRNSAFTPHEIQSLVQDINRGRPAAARWIACGDSSRLARCNPRQFALLVAASRPWICGDVAQVLVWVRHWTVDEDQPLAWYASVARLERVSGRWMVTRWLNHGSS